MEAIVLAIGGRALAQGCAAVLVAIDHGSGAELVAQGLMNASGRLFVIFQTG